MGLVHWECSRRLSVWVFKWQVPAAGEQAGEAAAALAAVLQAALLLDKGCCQGFALLCCVCLCHQVRLQLLELIQILALVPRDCHVRDVQQRLQRLEHCNWRWLWVQQLLERSHCLL